MTTTIYALEGIRHTYNGTPCVHIENLTLMSGEILGIQGPNGSGKSTFLSILAFLLKPTHGTIHFKGRLVDFRKPPRYEVTLLHQNAYLLKRSVFENVAYGLRVRNDTSNISQRVNEALELCGLPPESFAKRLWYELSGGEAQRVALASRIVLQPSALLLDEPTNSLDVASSKRLREAALRVREEYKTSLIVVSHDQQWLTTISDNLLEMNPK